MTDTLRLSCDAFDAYMLEELIGCTRAAAETNAETATRAAAIVAMFRSFNAATAMESMIAAHCVRLRFLLNAVMRDAEDESQDPVALARARQAALAMSRNLLRWFAKFDAVHAREEARAAGDAPRAGLPEPRARGVRQAQTRVAEPARQEASTAELPADAAAARLLAMTPTAMAEPTGSIPSGSIPPGPKPSAPASSGFGRTPLAPAPMRHPSLRQMDGTARMAPSGMKSALLASVATMPMARPASPV